MKDTLDTVVSLRVSESLAERLDGLASSERRTRANLMNLLLENALDGITVFTDNLEWLVRRLNEEETKNENSPQAEYLRGQLHDSKWALKVFCGAAVKDRVLDEVRKRTGLPIPHIVPLDRDGNRYGFDSDAG